MKKKRIVLHVVALVLALVCVVCTAQAALIYVERFTGNTVDVAKEKYGEHYAQNVERFLGTVYEQLNYRTLYGVGKNRKIDNLAWSSDEEMGFDYGFYYKIAKEESNLIILTNYSGSDPEKENIYIFDQYGLRGKADNIDDFLHDRMISFIDSEHFYFDGERVIKNKKLGNDTPFAELQKLCKENNCYLEMHTRANDEGIFAYLKEDIEENVTEEEMACQKKEFFQYVVAAAIFALLMIIPYIWLLIIAGHKGKNDRPAFHVVDKVWIDVVVFAFICVYCVTVIITGEELTVARDDYWYDRLVLTVWGGITLLVTEMGLQISESIARRLKTKSFIKTTLIGKICIYLKRAVIKMVRNMRLSAKVIVLCVVLELVFLADYVYIAVAADGILGAMCIIAIPVVVIGLFVWNYYKEKEIIIEETEKIAEGQVDNKIYDPMKFPTNKRLAKAVNGVGEGFSKAVSSSLKNERMKTELITNVSHDLKTPLTSIINYVDLLKTDGLDGEKAPEYLDVLDRKSQRLKTLTEDLVEASKLNSGVIELNVENIDIVQLVNQSLAEYSERFEQSGLHVIKNITRDTIIVRADGRKTWRALDNLYSNVCKYAMPGTRVYIDIFDEESNAVVSIKNISAGALNFSADELMERFVRGDVSRTTEGSGLGLSIAKSIMDRQNGELKITLDGDLFKVKMKLKKRG